jgi:hypothetical protein
MKSGKVRPAIFWGLVWMLTYVYSFEILWAISMRPVPCSSEIFDYRSSISHPAVILRQALWLLSFPSAQLLNRLIPDEPYTKELVYFPFGVALQWFGYGCLFGWFLQIRSARKKSPKTENNSRSGTINEQ